MRAPGTVALVAALAGLVAASGVAASPLVFTVKTRQGPTAVHPHPPLGGVGDSYVSSLRLVNAGIPLFGKGRHSTVGTMQFTYTLRSQCTSFGRQCASTADFDTVTMLPGGTVIASGKAISISRPTITIPVVGGTGRYEGARGTITISPSSTKFSTFRLIIP